MNTNELFEQWWKVIPYKLNSTYKLDLQESFQAGYDTAMLEMAELQNRVWELEEVLKMATGGECTCISGTRVCYSCRVQKIIDDALANTNPNSAEIQRLKVEIELLDSLSAEFFQSQDRGGAKYDIQRKAEQRRARLAELTKGE